MLELLNKSKGLGHDLHILSGANTYFIDQILMQYKISGLFSSVITNLSHWEDDLLVIEALSKTNHKCLTKASDYKKVCDASMCKGIDRIDLYLGFELNKIRSNNPEQRVIYVGDGRNDYCPLTKLFEYYF